jgi:hypothetical protein
VAVIGAVGLEAARGGEATAWDIGVRGTGEGGFGAGGTTSGGGLAGTGALSESAQSGTLSPLRRLGVVQPANPITSRHEIKLAGRDIPTLCGTAIRTQARIRAGMNPGAKGGQTVRLFCAFPAWFHAAFRLATSGGRLRWEPLVE